MNALGELESFISTDLDVHFHLTFLVDYMNSFGGRVKSINEDERYFEYVENDEVITKSFSSWFLLESINKMQNSFLYIERELINLSKENKDATGFLNLMSKKLGILIETVKESDNIKINLLPFLQNLKSKFDTIQNYNEFSNKTIDLIAQSYLWFGKDEEENLAQIKKIYQLLSDKRPLVSCTEQDFVDAFTNKEVKNGIRWLVKGKNGSISKPSLFYFIDKLIEKELLEEFSDVEYNSKINYVFRDSEGKEIKNIRQSKSSRTSNPVMAERIDDIINQVFNI